ncbi:glycosyltransferase [Nocardioides sp. CCNWLW239]|uniref:glycosyltransferase n=1 Tax=Nocardioides sp. CCNWLW239 TaxID=3128902 RepID=UPI003019E361
MAVRLEDLDLLRDLALADESVTVDRFTLTVRHWELPELRWSGRMGWLPGVRSLKTSFPSGNSGRAVVDLELRSPAPLAMVARAVYPLLGVERGLHGHGHLQLGTAGDLPGNGLALLPSRLAPGVPDTISTHLAGVGLSRADVGLVGSETTKARFDKDADDPQSTVFRSSLVVDPSGHLAVAERSEFPLVDLNVHNPIGRVQDFHESKGGVSLTLVGDELVFEPVDSSPIDPWSVPARSTLTARAVKRLRHVECIDLSRLVPLDAETELLLYRRLAELAATGAVLHSLPDTYLRADDILGPTLAASMRLAYRPATGLVRELRSVPQRREAMERFGGFYELADVVEKSGHRMLPKVSAVLSTMRPDRVSAVLRALAAQHYPHLEVIVAIHGADGPLPADFESAARACDAILMLQDRSVPFGTVLAEAAGRASGDLIVKIDDDDFYGPRVISDLVLAYLYSNADVVGKTTEYLYLEAVDQTVHRTFATETYHSQVAGGVMMLSTAALNEIGGWRPTPNSTDRSILLRIGNLGGIAYRTQSLGYVYVRHDDGHTWKRNDSHLVTGSFEQWPRFMDEIVTS